MSTHKPHAYPNAANVVRFYLLGDDYGNSRFATLKTAYRWYRSRKNPATLLVRRDRVADPQIPQISSYTASLRYPRGHIPFMGILISELRELLSLGNKMETDSVRPGMADWENAVPGANRLPTI